ncbi:MAG: pyridoxamine 5'-phosphate oxidase family protein [Chloroflexota bacterium]|nr:pyridoxamine 5'-phosphate oxidase family protein [Chloroflexia bacterium]MDQ3167632.1 pyridoxamine 5'-phosphate oxidase family protein [Chloroflexota bacterium]MDQ3513202.1 pyridoxamine 5'-phosphate oxidase family protein [Chloroflexota bacterium]
MVDVRALTNGRTARRLAEEKIIWIVSVRDDGRPHTVPVWFDWDGEAVTIFTKPGYQKVKNIRQDPRVVVSLDTANDGEEVDIFEGEATLLDRSSAEVVRPEYLEKYRQNIPAIGTTEEKMMAEYSQPIVVRLTRFMGW